MGLALSCRHPVGNGHCPVALLLRHHNIGEGKGAAVSMTAIPADVQQAVRSAVLSRSEDGCVVLSEVSFAVRQAFPKAVLDPEPLEDCIANEAALLHLAIEFDENAHKR